jgi:hypothetical protein
MGNARPRVVGTRAGAAFMAVVLSVAVVGTPTAALAQDAMPPPGSAHASASAPASAPATDAAPATAAGATPEVAPADVAALERGECTRQLLIAEDALERDGKYARNWTDAWYVVGASLITLSLTSIFQYHDYRVAEQIVNASLGGFLMIQVPDATTNHRALKGIRTAGVSDPCLALTNARFIAEVNAEDARQHQTAFSYIFPIGLNIFVGAVVAAATGHWDFAGHGDEGLGTLIGIAASEIAVVTYPQPSIKFSGSSLSGTF